MIGDHAIMDDFFSLQRHLDGKLTLANTPEFNILLEYLASTTVVRMVYSAQRNICT